MAESWLRRSRWLLRYGGSLLLIGCMGDLNGSQQSETSRPPPEVGAAGNSNLPGNGAPPAETETGASTELTAEAFSCNEQAPLDPGPSPLQRLTPVQYKNAVHDIWGDAVDLSQIFPEVKSRAYIGLVQPDVSQVDVETYAAAAASIASSVASNASRFAPCDAQADLAAGEACMQAFLATSGTRIYRTKLNEADTARLIEIFDLGFNSQGYAHGLELVVQAMLQAPRFLYRPEFGDASQSPQSTGATAVALSQYEVASRLSFAFWNSAPDDTLIDAAEKGTLSTEEGRQAQVVRLMNDERARDSFRQFLYAWLGLGDLDTVVKDRVIFPSWQDDTADQMRQQSDAFFDEVLFGGGGTLASLFTLPLQQFAPPALGEWYQGSVPNNGVLTLPALLTVQSKPTESFPIYRGKMVREQLLCQSLPPPPSAAAATPPAPQPGVSTRQRFEQHSADPSCNVCHKLMDPIGFAFENYDAIGRYRTEADGFPVDATGQLTGTDVDGSFNGVGELSARLVTSKTVQSCVARQWFRYEMQRFEQASDNCSMRALMNDFVASGYRFTSLRTAIVKTPAFLNRRPITLNEVSP